jgi:hypothetical protein
MELLLIDKDRPNFVLRGQNEDVDYEFQKALNELFAKWNDQLIQRPELTVKSELVHKDLG